jgi:hypothetical protein
VQARIVASRQQFERDIKSGLHNVTISEAAMNDFDEKWKSAENRMKIVPGKEIFSALNAHLQKKYNITLSPIAVIESFSRNEIGQSIVDLLNKLNEIRKEDAADQVSLELTAEPST